MGVCLHVCLFPWRSEDSMESPGTEVTDDCEPPYGFCEPNSGPVEEQLVLLTTEPSLWPLCEFFLVLYVCMYMLLAWVCVHVCMCMYMCIQVCVRVYRCVCTSVYVCLCVCVYTDVYVFVCTCVYRCVFSYMQTRG